MNLITINNPTSAAAEAYRTLRTNLHFAALEAPLKSVIVTSPGDQENAALVAANLAVTLAQSEKRVILVDAQLRQPVLHSLFGLQNGMGLADVLVNTSGASNGLGEPQLQPTAIAGLQLLSAGTVPQVPADVISSPRMTQLIQKLLTQSDMVVFSTPPLTLVSDAAVLASRVDGALLVIQAGKTQRDRAQQAKEILARAKVRLLGAVMLK